MAQPFNNFQHKIPIAELHPSIDKDSSSITGVVALIWPYSSAGRTFSFLLAEPDFRLRRKNGQVLVRFCGSSAKAIAKCGVIIGDQVSLSLIGASWVKDDHSLRTPGRGVEFDLLFRERLVIQVYT